MFSLALIYISFIFFFSAFIYWYLVKMKLNFPWAFSPVLYIFIWVSVFLPSIKYTSYCWYITTRKLRKKNVLIDNIVQCHVSFFYEVWRKKFLLWNFVFCLTQWFIYKVLIMELPKLTNTEYRESNCAHLQ